MLNAYPGIQVGKLTFARFYGLLNEITDLPPHIAVPPAQTSWMERSLDRMDKEMSIAAMAPGKDED